MRALWDAAADLLLGARCAGCGTPAWGVCAGCCAALRGTAAYEVQRHVPGFPATSAAGDYDAALRRLVAAHKERGARQATPVLGELLANAAARRIAEATDRGGPVTLVPVPSQRATVRHRGYDSVRLLADEAARQLRRRGQLVRVVAALEHRRRVSDQSTLNTSDRWANLEGALTARPVPGRVVVVDDVCTTGATLAEASRALRAVGVTATAATVSATVLRHGSPGAQESPPSGLLSGPS